MGLGAAASEPGTLSVLRHIYTDDRARARAVGVWAAVSGLALALGPVIGGAIIGAWNWRGIFWFNLFFGLAGAARRRGRRAGELGPARRAGRHAGTVLGAGALATLVFGIIDAETSSFAATVPVTLFCVAAVLAVGVRLVGAPGREPAARPAAVPAALVHGAERRRVLHLLLDVRDLLLHRAVPGRGPRRLRLPDRARLRADDGADDRLVGARRLLDRAAPGRAGRSSSGAPLFARRAAAREPADQHAPELLPARSGPRGWPASASASRSCRSPPPSSTRCRPTGQGWPPPPPTPAGRSAPSPASPSSARSSSPRSTPASPPAWCGWACPIGYKTLILEFIETGQVVGVNINNYQVEPHRRQGDRGSLRGVRRRRAPRALRVGRPDVLRGAPLARYSA